jgi:DNA-directed RNA polymerase alpha subunit
VEKQQAKAEAEALRAQLKEYEDAKLSVEEKTLRSLEEATTRATSFEQQVREASLKYELAMAAREENITDIRAAVKLADRELIEYDSVGNITNLPDVIQALKSEYSSLFTKAASAPNTGVTNPAKAPSAKKWTRADLAQLSPERRLELMQSGELNDLLGRK